MLLILNRRQDLIFMVNFISINEISIYIDIMNNEYCLKIGGKE